MTVQITVRLPDDLVAFVDDEVRRGAVRSRAQVVEKALARERRHRAALDDVAILRAAESGGADDLDGLAAHMAEHPSALDD